MGGQHSKPIDTHDHAGGDFPASSDAIPSCKLIDYRAPIRGVS
jgi:hypothetical protein